MRAKLRVFFGDRSHIRFTALAALAATLAFIFGSIIPIVSAPVAAITALVAVRPTFHESAQEGFRQVIGVVIGGLSAYLMVQFFGVNPLVVFATIAISFIAARLLRLGEEGAIATGVTVILVIGFTFDPLDVEQRLLGVFVGCLMALLVSLYTRPGAPHQRALDDILFQAERLSLLLAEIAASLPKNGSKVSSAHAKSWLSDAENIVQEIEIVRGNAESALTGSRWSPLLPRAEAEAVLEQVRITSATALTVVNICRDFLLASEREEHLPTDLVDSISDVLLATADVISEQSGQARNEPAKTLPRNSEPLIVARESRREAVDTLREVEDTQPLLIGGSLLRDTSKISDVLTEES